MGGIENLDDFVQNRAPPPARNRSQPLTGAALPCDSETLFSTCAFYARRPPSRPSDGIPAGRRDLEDRR